MGPPLIPLAILLSTVRAAAAPLDAPPTPPLAVLTEVSGRVTVLHAGTPEAIPAEEDMELGEGDQVFTGPGGKAVLAFLDEHFVHLDGRATLSLKTLKSEPSRGTFWARLALAGGKLMAAVSSLTGDGSLFEVATPTAVAAIKGTTFAVTDGKTESTISVLEGAVETAGAGDGPPETVSVLEGYETVVTKKARRPGALRKLFKNKKRKKFVVTMSEFRARAIRLRSQGRSGELGRSRRTRNLVRAMYAQKFKQDNPKTYRAMPDWRRERLDRFLASAGPDLEARRAELAQFLKKNPKLKARLEKEAKGRFKAKKQKPPRATPAKGGKGKREARPAKRPRK